MNAAKRSVRAWAAAGCLVAATLCVHGQQILTRGALGMPSQVYDEIGQWTTPLPVSGSAEEGMYIPDISNANWLARNYPDYVNKGVFTVTMYTHYRQPEACRRDLQRWGFGDAAHLDACVDVIGYRMRQMQVDTIQKTITLITAAMIDQDGQLLPDAIPAQSTTRRWAELDSVAIGAVAKTTQLVGAQMNAYARRISGS